MKFSTKSEYGLRALVCLAKQQDFYSLAQIAKQEKISLPYLERLFAKLKKAKIVESQKGVKGGYKLTKPADQINIKDIFIALGEDISPYNCICLDLPSVCQKKGCKCHVKIVWQKLDHEISRTLEEIKLGDLI